jgi:predicted AAA+ superfamily ATPase
MRPTNNKDIEFCLSLAQNHCDKSAKRKRYLCVYNYYWEKQDWDLLMGRRRQEVESLVYYHWVRSTYKVRPGEVVFVVETTTKVKVGVKSYSNVMMEESDGRAAANLKHKLMHNRTEYLTGKEIDKIMDDVLQWEAGKVAPGEMIIMPTMIENQ